MLTIKKKGGRKRMMDGASETDWSFMFSTGRSGTFPFEVWFSCYCEKLERSMIF